MSEFLSPAFITASVTVEDGATMLADAMERLVEHHAFNMKFGGISRFEYIGETYVDLTILVDHAPLEAIGRERIYEFVAQHTSIAIEGDFFMDGVARSLPVLVGLHRTFDPERPVCLIVHLHACLDHAVRDEDTMVVDHDAADRFQYLALALAAHDLTDGFITVAIDSVSEAPAFDGQALRASYISPRSVNDRWRERHKDTVIVTHGNISGIKASLVTLEELRRGWSDSDIFESVTGMFIISVLHIDMTWILDDDD